MKNQASLISCCDRLIEATTKMPDESIATENPNHEAAMYNWLIHQLVQSPGKYSVEGWWRFECANASQLMKDYSDLFKYNPDKFRQVYNVIEKGKPNQKERYLAMLNEFRIELSSRPIN